MESSEKDRITNIEALDWREVMKFEAPDYENETKEIAARQLGLFYYYLELPEFVETNKLQYLYDSFMKSEFALPAISSEATPREKEEYYEEQGKRLQTWCIKSRFVRFDRIVDYEMLAKRGIILPEELAKINSATPEEDDKSASPREDLWYYFYEIWNKCLKRAFAQLAILAESGELKAVEEEFCAPLYEKIKAEINAGYEEFFEQKKEACRLSAEEAMALREKTIDKYRAAKLPFIRRGSSSARTMPLRQALFLFTHIKSEKIDALQRVEETYCQFVTDCPEARYVGAQTSGDNDDEIEGALLFGKWNDKTKKIDVDISDEEMVHFFGYGSGALLNLAAEANEKPSLTEKALRNLWQMFYFELYFLTAYYHAALACLRCNEKSRD